MVQDRAQSSMAKLQTHGLAVRGSSRRHRHGGASAASAGSGSESRGVLAGTINDRYGDLTV